MRHRDALATAGATGQVTALSLLVSMYLQSVYAASSEEIEIFLSPVASRSRVREAVRGLSATRQIQSLSMDAQTYYFLEGGLPEFAEPAVSPSAGGTDGRSCRGHPRPVRCAKNGRRLPVTDQPAEDEGARLHPRARPAPAGPAEPNLPAAQRDLAGARTGAKPRSPPSMAGPRSG